MNAGRWLSNLCVIFVIAFVLVTVKLMPRTLGVSDTRTETNLSDDADTMLSLSSLKNENAGVISVARPDLIPERDVAGTSILHEPVLLVEDAVPAILEPTSVNTDLQEQIPENSGAVAGSSIPANYGYTADGMLEQLPPQAESATSVSSIPANYGYTADGMLEQLPPQAESATSVSSIPTNYGYTSDGILETLPLPVSQANTSSVVSGNYGYTADGILELQP